MTFRMTLLLSGKNACGFEAPREVVEALGKGKRPPVVVTINDYTYRNTVAVFGDVFMVWVSAEHRAASGTRAGDELEVNGAKTDETRQRRIEKSVATLREGRPR